MNLGDWRSRIDDLDDQILNLLNQRAEAARHIGDLKRRQDAPSYVPEREANILRRLAAHNPGPLCAAAVRAVRGAIRSGCRTPEAPTAIASELAGRLYGFPARRTRIEDNPRDSTPFLGCSDRIRRHKERA